MDKRAGIDRARLAGMEVDHAVEELMEAAPIGSCANDPTLPQCPPAVAFVRVGDGNDGAYADPDVDPNPTPGSVPSPTPDPESEPERLPPPSGSPVASAAIFQCLLRGSTPYRAAGRAQGDA